MNGLAIWGFFLIALSLGPMAWSLFNDCIPARWPMPRMYRSEHPVYYCLTIAGCAVGAAFGVAFVIISRVCKVYNRYFLSRHAGSVFIGRGSVLRSCCAGRLSGLCLQRGRTRAGVHGLSVPLA